MKGILLVNLGSPISTETKDVRSYLDQFLMDKRVIDKNIVFRNLLVRGIILNTRPKKSGAAYKRIWWQEGSPLIVISERVTAKLQAILDIPVALAMSYGSMSIKDGLQSLVDKGVTEISMFPLYPQYAMSSTETVVAKTQEEIAKHFPQVKLSIVPPFYNDEDYLNVFAAHIKKHLPADYDKLLFSYHGIPERHVIKYDHTGNCALGDCCSKENQPQHTYCYRHQTYTTTAALTQRLGLTTDQYTQSFQSRLGRDPWIQPFTDVVLESLPAQGVKKLAVVCPAFVSDCLETLEEIEMEGAEEYKKHGGETFNYIPCLNEEDEWIAVMKKLALQAFEVEYNIPLMMVE